MRAQANLEAWRTINKYIYKQEGAVFALEA